MKIKLNIMCVGLLAVSVLSLMSCSDQNKSANSSVWELKPPEFETDSGEKNEPTLIKRYDNAANEEYTVALKPSDRIRFSFNASDSGATLLMKTVCTPNAATTPSPAAKGLTTLATTEVFYEKNIRVPLSQKISIYEFLPIEALYQPSGKLVELPCRLHIIAQNSRGSTHDFGTPIRFVLKAQEQTDFLKIESRRSALKIGHSLGYVGISKGEAYDVPLPALASNQNFLLKCEDFQIRTSGKATLADLEQLPDFISAINKNSRDQLCRLFIEERGAIKKMSNFFMLDIYNVDNLVHSVDWSIIYPDENQNKNSFQVATVSIANKTNEIYYARLSPHRIGVEIISSTYQKPSRIKTSIELDTRLSDPNVVITLQPGSTRQLTLLLPMKQLCPFSYLELKIESPKEVPTLQLTRQDPRVEQNPVVDVSIPMLEPSSMPAIFIPAKHFENLPMIAFCYK